MKTTAFPSEVQDQLKYYVYRLIDPRNGETFYVGKGKGNRVFDHARAVVDGTDEASDKLQRIHDIRRGDLDVMHVIHRHGIEDESTALEVEAALMDAFPATTNIAGGTSSSDFGIMHADEIMVKYAAAETRFRHSVVAITVNRTVAEKSVYQAVRSSWKISRGRAEQADYVLAVINGLIVGVFIADRWYPDEDGTRYEFDGREADDNVRRMYINTRIPSRLRKPGAANPVRYFDPQS